MFSSTIKHFNTSSQEYSNYLHALADEYNRLQKDLNTQLDNENLSDVDKKVLEFKQLILKSNLEEKAKQGYCDIGVWGNPYDQVSYDFYSKVKESYGTYLHTYIKLSIVDMHGGGGIKLLRISIAW